MTTLTELGVKPGDVVKSLDAGGSVLFPKGQLFLVSNDLQLFTALNQPFATSSIQHPFRFVARLWSQMTAEEKGALLLAYHEGQPLEWSADGRSWYQIQTMTSLNKGLFYYRLKLEKQVMFLSLSPKEATNFSFIKQTDSTHRLSFDISDPESTAKLEKLR